MILASMSPDMAQDIIDLITSQGQSVVRQITRDDEGSSPRPLAIFSRDYIADEDFAYTYIGATTAQLYQFRTLAQDFDFFEKVLQGAFSIPKDMAASIAKGIETRDVIGGYEGTDISKSLPWYKSWWDKLGEGIRQGVNVLGNPFGWENDQDQEYDFDFLYELHLLGEAVGKLGTRQRLMRSQFVINKSTGLFGGDKAYGDVYGDPNDASTAELLAHVAPLTGSPLPGKIFGGLKDLVSKAISGGNTSIAAQLGGKTKPDPQMLAAIANINDSDPSAISKLNPLIVGSSVIETIGNELRNRAAIGDASNSAMVIRELYGDVAMEAWNRADVPAFVSHVAELAGDVLETTGDPELDQAIITDVLNADQERGDATEEDETEIGGLFKRARINHQLRKAAKYKRKNSRRAGKLKRKEDTNAALINARAQAAAAQYNSQGDENEEDAELEDINDQTGNSQALSINDGTFLDNFNI